MEGVAEKRKINHGRNIKMARTCQDITQEDLGFRVNMSQSKISALELEEEIEKPVLEEIAEALSIPVRFLTDFEPEDMMNSYNVYENDFTTGEHSHGDNIGQKIVEQEENNYYPLDKVTELYERLLQEKDRQIEELKAKLK